MPKECTGGNPDIERPCVAYAGGQCEAAYFTTHFYSATNDDGFSFTQQVNTFSTLQQGANNNRQFIGALGCISAPYESGGYKFDIYLASGNGTFEKYVVTINTGSTFIRNISSVVFTGVTRTGGLPDNCGDYDPSIDNSVCECTGGDEEITCNSSRGGICCIPRSSLDSLCDFLT